MDILENLKPVFDSCDVSGDGFVMIDDLLQLGKQHAFENLDVSLSFYLFYIILPLFELSLFRSLCSLGRYSLLAQTYFYQSDIDKETKLSCFYIVLRDDL